MIEVEGKAVIDRVWKNHAPYKKGWEWNLVVSTQTSGKLAIKKIFPKDQKTTMSLNQTLVPGKSIYFKGKFNPKGEIVCSYFGKCKDDHYEIKVTGEAEKLYSYSLNEKMFDINFKLDRSQVCVKMHAFTATDVDIQKVQKVLSESKKLQLKGIFVDRNIYIQHLKAA